MTINAHSVDILNSKASRIFNAYLYDTKFDELKMINFF
jgi:hypothetical protein